MTGAVIYIVEANGQKHTLKSWSEVSHFCHVAFAEDPKVALTIKHIAVPGPALT